ARAEAPALAAAPPPPAPAAPPPPAPELPPAPAPLSCAAASDAQRYPLTTNGSTNLRLASIGYLQVVTHRQLGHRTIDGRDREAMKGRSHTKWKR
ncbi:MAG: hypothetical protein EOO73_14930, partial [Myxococcales bacterium]